MALRLGLIGRGRWGRNIERTLSSFPDVSVTIVSRGQPPPHELNGVLIATPSASHAKVALPYIAKGIATFIEKPMATSVADAERIRETAIRAGAPVFVGHIHLYNPAFQALLHLLPKLGAIHSALCEGMNSQVKADSSVLWDWLPHDLSRAHAIFKRNPVSVEARPLTGSSTIEAAEAEFLFGEVTLRSIVSWISPVRRQCMTISAENGTIIFDDLAGQKLSVRHLDGSISHPSYDDEPPLTRELRAFLEMVRLGCPDTAHLDLGMNVIRAIAAAESSIRKGAASVKI